MNDAVCDTLFLPLRQGMIPDLSLSDRVGFLNAFQTPQLHDFSKCIQAENLHCYTFFKSEYDLLKANGFHVFEGFESQKSDFYDVILIMIPKNVIESHYLIAHGLRCLKSGGTLICAAANNAGGARIQKWFHQFGLKDAQSISKNKCRVVFADFGYDFDQEFYDAALVNGSRQKSQKTEFMTQPGIFGWDRVDPGSEILTRHLPSDLSGQGADFGCGYGYLSHHVLNQPHSITDLHCIDIDKRAIDVCAENVAFCSENVKIQFHWQDLCTGSENLNALDFIVMNPPFHKGKSTLNDLGIAFIKTAADCLKTGGALWMVANTHLPYEFVLSECFDRFDMIGNESGFKVIHAVR